MLRVFTSVNDIFSTHFCERNEAINSPPQSNMTVQSCDVCQITKVKSTAPSLYKAPSKAMIRQRSILGTASSKYARKGFFSNKKALAVRKALKVFVCQCVIEDVI